MDSINSVQQALLMKLGLAEKIYKKEILPELPLTLDHKRLSDKDKIQKVLVHCTPSPNRKFEKAVLARVDKIMQNRDEANRINKISYYAG